MFIKVHVTVKCDANVYARFRRRDNKIAYIHRIERRSRSMLSVRNEWFSLVDVEFKRSQRRKFQCNSLYSYKDLNVFCTVDNI